MSDKLTTKEVESRIGKYGFILIGEYINNQTPLKVEKDGYWFSASLNNLEKNGNASMFGVSNPYLEHNFRRAIEQRNATVQYIAHEIVVKKNRKRVLVTLQCQCGNMFVKDGSQILSSKINLCCPECYKIHKSQVHSKDKQGMIELFTQRGYTIVEEPKIINSTELWLIEDVEGYRGRLSYGKLRNGRELSIYGNNNRDLRIYNLQVFFNKIHSNSIPLYMVDNYTVCIQCECGETFECLYYRVFDDIRHKCPKCNGRQSKYESMVQLFLERQHITFKAQFIINECRDKLPLPFDFCLLDYNALIEVDGQQHFVSVNFWGGDEQLKYIQSHDTIKTIYCAKYDIPLLRIPYTAFDDGTYKDLILSFIQTVQD